MAQHDTILVWKQREAGCFHSGTACFPWNSLYFCVKLHDKDILSSIFNVCLTHGKIPQVSMQTVIAAICTNKNGNIWVSDAGKYRPVSLTSTISKLFEHYILSCISPFVVTQTNSWQVHIFIQTMLYYVNKGTPVFPAFLNVSKAFSTTNHNLLFAKLIWHHLPMWLVTQLMSWYEPLTLHPL